MIHFCLNLGKSQFLRKIMEKFSYYFCRSLCDFLCKGFSYFEAFKNELKKTNKIHNFAQLSVIFPKQITFSI